MTESETDIEVRRVVKVWFIKHSILHIIMVLMIIVYQDFFKESPKFIFGIIIYLFYPLLLIFEYRYRILNKYQTKFSNNISVLIDRRLFLLTVPYITLSVFTAAIYLGSHSDFLKNFILYTNFVLPSAFFTYFYLSYVKGGT